MDGSLTHGSADRRAAGWWGGGSLVAAAVSFMAVFTWLAARFDYPDVLDGAAADVLPALLGLGDTGRAVWVVYALLPLLLIPGGIGTYASLRGAAPHAMRAALVLAVVAALSMLVGLGRWPTLHWELARAWGGGSAEARQAIAAVFAGANLYLGTFIGEFVGEIALNGFFALSAYALLCAGSPRLGWTGLLAAALGFVAALRNVAPLVSIPAEVDNYALPLWLILLGVAVIGRGRRPTRGTPPTA